MHAGFFKSGLGRAALLSAGAIAAFTATDANATEIRDRPSVAASDCDSTAPTKAEGTHCFTDENGTRLGFRSSLPTTIGTIETFATISGRSSNAFTPDRLTASDSRRLGEANRVMITGLTARLLDNRVTLSTQFGWSDLVDRSAPRAEVRTGSAQMIRLDLKLVDSAKVRWSVAGEISDVSDNFFIGQAMAEGARLALPGRRMAVSTALNWQQARLTAAHDDYRSSFGEFASTRFGLSRNGVSLSLRSGMGSLRTTAESPILSGRTTSRGVTLEIDLTTLIPSLAFDQRLPTALLPRSILLGWRGGSRETGMAGAIERFERQGIEVNGTWETPIGETSLGLWRDRRIGATAELGQREEQVASVTHMVRRGDWRFGVDAMITRNTSNRGRGLTDRNVSVGGLIAYEVANGPRLMVQLSGDHGRMAADDDSFLNLRRGQQVSATLDLTDYLRKRFDRRICHCQRCGLDALRHKRRQCRRMPCRCRIDYMEATSV